MDPLNAIGSFVNGWIHEGHLQAWIRLGISVAITALVTFLGIFGGSILTMHAQLGPLDNFITALGTASVTTAVTILYLWRKSPLSKGIPIAIPGFIEAKLAETETKDGMTISNVK